ncbi:MAG: ROK family protein [Rhodoferax sp.]
MDCLTLDIGGTKTAAAWWQGGLLLQRREEPTAGDAPALLEQLARMLSGGPPVQCVGAAVTGVTDGRRVGVLNRQMIGGWDGLPLAEHLEQLLGVPAWLLNDAQAAAWGEYRARADAPADLLFVTVSTGIGAGIVLDGRLRSGSTGLAGHLGHGGARAAGGGQAPGSACSCGRGDCLEWRASGSAMARDLAALGLGLRSARAWMAAPHQDHPAVQDWLDRATRAVAEAIADAHALLDLHGVLLGGGLGLHPRFLQGVQRAMLALPARFRVPVDAARLGSDAGLRGMACWLQDRPDASD